MHAAVLSVNWALNLKPSLPKNSFALGRSLTGRLTNILVFVLMIISPFDLFCCFVSLPAGVNQRHVFSRTCLRRLSRTRFLFAECAREVFSEILRLVDQPEFDLSVLERRALQPLDRLLLGVALPQPEAAYQFLRLGERPVGYDGFLAGERHPGACGHRREPFQR